MALETRPPALALEGDSWLGIVRCHGRRYWVCANVEHGEARIDLQADLGLLLQGQEQLLKSRLGDSASFEAFLTELTEIVDRTLAPVASWNVGAVSGSLCLQLLAEMEKVGWDRLIDIDDNLRSFGMLCNDAADRVHTLRVSVPSDYPASALTCRADLPERRATEWRASTISQAAEVFGRHLAAYQVLWDQVDDLYDNAWVLEPIERSRSATIFRIAVEPVASLQVLVDVREPRSVPSIRFLGSDAAVAPLRTNLNRMLGGWDRGRSLRENIEYCLQQPLPPKPAPALMAATMQQLECAVCYSYRLGDEVPEKTCSGRQCGRSFHVSCISEWLRAVPTTRVSFQSLFGSCPYCQEPLAVQLS